MRSGITVIEIIMVIAILAIVASTSVPILSNFILRNNLTNVSNQIIGSIRKAQDYAMNGRDGAVWGVCQSGNSIRLFSGSCASPSYFEDYTISSSIIVSGLSETTFSPLRGEPSSALSVTITTGIGSSSVIMNIAGGMDIN